MLAPKPSGVPSVMIYRDVCRVFQEETRCEECQKCGEELKGGWIYHNNNRTLITISAAIS